MKASAEETLQSLLGSLASQREEATPYHHFYLDNCLPDTDVDEILDLPFQPQDVGGVSGAREIHNKSRSYFDAESCKKYSVCDRVAEAMQSQAFIDAVSKTYHVSLDNCYLRIEYAQDTKGFWLEPHTDIGVKEFTMLLYLSRDGAHETLGTDIYDTDKNHVRSAPFISNTALVFVPSDITYHGFEEREITGVRKSIIMNYVTDDWRAREQLAFPENPVFSS